MSLWKRPAYAIHNFSFFGTFILVDQLTSALLRIRRLEVICQENFGLWKYVTDFLFLKNSFLSLCVLSKLRLCHLPLHKKAVGTRKQSSVHTLTDSAPLNKKKQQDKLSEYFKLIRLKRSWQRLKLLAEARIELFY